MPIDKEESMRDTSERMRDTTGGVQVYRARDTTGWCPRVPSVRSKLGLRAYSRAPLTDSESNPREEGRRVQH